MTTAKKYKMIEKSVSDLIPYINNSRTHSQEQVKQIASSIKEFGFTNPVLIDDKNMIIAGHGRTQAADLLKLDKVPCIILSGLTEAQKKAYVIADNKLALNAGWDEAMLANEIANLQELDYDVSLLGFEDYEISDLLDANLDLVEGLTDDDEVPEVPETPVTVEGDIWLLGDHRLMCGDSTSIDHAETLMGGSLADMLLTDPPYNVAIGCDETPEQAKKRNRRTDGLIIKNDNMDDCSFRQFLIDVYTAADAVMKKGAVFYIWHADSEGYNFRGAAKDMGWEIRQCLIWVKSTMVMGRQDYHWKHETCLYGWKSGASHLWASDRKQTTILNFDKPNRNAIHPTMKPVELFEYQVLNNTKGQDIVLDLFGGSGTTIISCEKHGRRGYVMELDPKYCDVIVKRWQDFTGKTATHAESGKTFEEVGNDR